MKNNKAIQIFENFKKDAENLYKDPEKFTSLLGDVKSMIEGKNKGALASIITNVSLTLSMLNDWRKKEYTKVPKRTIISIIGALIYLVSPIDAIPDFLGPLGFVDDIFIFNLVYKGIKKDLDDYVIWKESQGKEIEALSPEPKKD